MADSNKVYRPDIETVDEFFERFTMQNSGKLTATGVTDAVKNTVLVNNLPIEVLTDLQRRIAPKTLSNSTYAELESNLKSAYGTKKSVIGACVNFMSRKQKSGESIEVYSKSLNQLASMCDYGSCCRNRLIRDSFITGLRSMKIMSTLIAECEGKTFQEVVERAKIIEQISIDVEDIAPHNQDSRAQAYKISGNHKKSPTHHQSHKDKSSNVPNNKYRCYRCGSTGKHFANQCYALSKTCNKCNKKGHLSPVCRSKPSSQNGKQNNSNQFNYVVNPEEDDPALFHTIAYMKGKKSVSRSSSDVASLDMDFPPLTPAPPLTLAASGSVCDRNFPPLRSRANGKPRNKHRSNSANGMPSAWSDVGCRNKFSSLNSFAELESAPIFFENVPSEQNVFSLAKSSVSNNAKNRNVSSQSNAFLGVGGALQVQS